MFHKWTYSVFQAIRLSRYQNKLRALWQKQIISMPITILVLKLSIFYINKITDKKKIISIIITVYIIRTKTKYDKIRRTSTSLRYCNNYCIFFINTTCLCNKNNREFNIFLDFFKFNRPIFIIHIWKNKQHFRHLFPITYSYYRNFICAVYKNYIYQKIKKIQIII